ncbi:hypothetical protein HFO42_20205 [Rhizobium leguminosarum]|uniref:Uncharacterized protein n=1 Tax=Rhizobium leguminosarum TaxID=384 RepID=A0AAJ1EIZ1_RHILE|nr:hypothetical protein [Rhizobium leguminosarum]MBY5630414.1 hypothetical protein [Rhizobium leguminosarum]
MSRNFVVTVKERGPDEPCFVQFELHADIGLKTDQLITLDLAPGTTIDDAKELASLLNSKAIKISL